MKCVLSASYSWKKNRIRHLEFGKVEVELSEDEIRHLQNDNSARVNLFKQNIPHEVYEILQNDVDLAIIN